MTGKGNSRAWGGVRMEANVDAPRSGTIVTHSALMNTARSLVRGGHGILAADESLPTVAKRFAAIGIPSTAETRRTYRDMLISAVGIGESISGVTSSSTKRSGSRRLAVCPSRNIWQPMACSRESKSIEAPSSSPASQGNG